MSDLSTTILIKAKDEASESIRKIANSTKDIGDVAKGSIGGVNALGAALKSAFLPIVSIGMALEGFRKSLSLASDLQEANSKAMMVFRNNTDQLNTAIKNLTQSYGMSAVEATKALGQLGDLFKPLGFAEKDALSLSETTVKLAKDLASFNNLNTDDVLRDIQSALVGNTESVRKYGVVLNEVTIQQAAVNAGLDPKNLSPSQKAWLILNEIIRSNADALGDYQRNQDSFANSIRRLQTFFTEIAVSFGNVFLEIINPIVSGFADIAFNALPYVVKAIQGFGQVLKFVIELVKGLLQAFDLLATFLIRSFGDVVLKAFTPLLKLITHILQTVASFYNKLVELANSVGINIPKITFDFNNASEEFINNLDNMIKKIKEGKTLFEALGLTAAKTATSISQNLPSVNVSVPVNSPSSSSSSTAASKEKTVQVQALSTQTDVFMTALMSFVNSFVNALSQASVAFGYLYNIIDTFAKNFANRLAVVIDDIFLPFVKVLDSFIIILGETFGNLLNALTPLLQVLASNVINQLSIFVLQIVQLLQFIIPAIQFISQILSPFMQAVSFVLNLIYNVLASIYNNIFVPIINIFIKAFNAIGGFFSGAINWVIDVINGVINAINTVLSWLRWGTIGTIGKINWENIREVSAVTVPSSTSAIGGAGTTGGTAYNSGGGLSVQNQRPIVVNFTNNGVLTGFKNDDEFIQWIKNGLKLASERGL